MDWLQCVVFPLLILIVSGNSPPKYIGPNFVQLPEDLPLGSFAFNITAEDPDNDTLFYGLEGDYAYYFSINSMTGEVKIGVLLDYETIQGFSVDAFVRDTDNPVVRRRIPIIVDNCNDNAPIFLNTPYAVNIEENQAKGTILFTVSATDSDAPNLSVIYAIDEVTPNNAGNRLLFSIDTNGSIILNGTLDYNTQSIFYQLKIIATDRGGLFHKVYIYRNTTAYLSINVIDVPNLDPQFLRTPYVASVLENSKLGTPVFTVSAIDEDRGISDEIIYSIYNATIPGLFSIENSTGVISVIGTIDREQLLDSNEQVLLVVVAEERHVNIHNQTALTSTEVTVRIMDMNDNTPEFYNCELPDCNFNTTPQSQYFGSIEEHSSTRVPVENLTITVHDPDKESNGTFTLHLEGPNAASFVISPTKAVNTGQVQILVRDPNAVDYEKLHVMHVEIVANDSAMGQKCCSFANVTIHIIDVNDHSPVFADTVYKLNVMENSKNGTHIGRITATDEDTGLFGELTYALLPESISDTFQVNSTTGVIAVKDGELLDREKRGTYYATLQARDGMNLTGTAQLEITVEDENDNAPVVIGSYTAFVNENTGSVHIQIEANDNDEPGTNNSRLQFEILGGPYSMNFTIDRDSGLLTNPDPLDREAIDSKLNGKIVLTVRVYDLGNPQLQDLVNVTITVEDENDNSPEFSSSVYQFFVAERQKGAFIGSVAATDADQTEVNNRITFQIVKGGSGTFLIRSYRVGMGRYMGNITLDPDIDLDYETQKNFTLSIQAQDTDISNLDLPLALVFITVEDINDEPPIIESASLQGVKVCENGTQHGLVTTIRGYDKDSQHQLLFQELGVACYKGAESAGSICSGWFQLDSNGSLLINESEAIDFEKCDRVVLSLRVEDVLTELGDRYSSNETITITIVDVNDQAPVFLETDEAFAVIPDVSLSENQVAWVQATDEDTGTFGEISFSLGPVEFISLSGASTTQGSIFKVVTTSESQVYTGSIRVASSLDFSLTGRYNVTVMAHDRGGLSTTKYLNIYAVDQSSSVKLEFSVTTDKVYENLDNIKSALMRATHATVYVAGIKAAGASARAARAPVQSDMEAYFVYKNGTALMHKNVIELIQKDSEALSTLLEYGLSSIAGSSPLPSRNNNKTYVGIIVGLAAGLVLVMAVMIAALVCTRKSFKRKLKAVKAMKEARTMPSTAVQGGPSIPGTNMYTKDGANPVLNLNIDSAIDLGFDDHRSTSDSVSLNSLDVQFGNESQQEGQDIASSMVPRDILPQKPSSREEPLSAALKGRNPKDSQDTRITGPKPDDSPFVFQNEILDTTDL